MYQFSWQFLKFPEFFLMLTPITPQTQVGWGLKNVIDFLGSPSHFLDFLIFDSLKFPCWPSWTGWGNCFRFEPFPDLATYMCQIWSRSNGRVGKNGVQTDKGTLQLYIVEAIITNQVLESRYIFCTIVHTLYAYRRTLFSCLW